MPVVPRIDSPPTMPSRGFSVFRASASPPGMAISTSTSAARRRCAPPPRRLSRIIWRGTGLMAGSPGGSGRPARVTVPTPSPGPERRRRVPGAPARTVAITSAPWVTSGSSPASLTMPARVPPSHRFRERQGKGRPRAARQHDLDRIGKLARRASPDRPPWPPRWRRRRWSSRGATSGGFTLVISPLITSAMNSNSHLGTARHGGRTA